MLKELLRLFKHTCVYAVGNVGQRALQFVLLPIYTRLLTPADYGVLEMMTAFGAILAIFMQLGLRAGFTRTYLYKGVEAGRSLHERSEILGTTIFSLFGWSTVFLFIVIPFAPKFSEVLIQNAGQAHLVRLVIIWAWGTALFQIPQAYYINNEKSKTFVVLSTLQLAFGLGLVIYWVVVIRLGVEGVLRARMVASVIFGVGLCVWLLWREGSGLHWRWLKPMLRFGIPTFGGILASQIPQLANRFLVQRFSGILNLGLYGVGNKIAGIMSLTLVGAFTGAWVPYQYKLANQPNHRQMIGRLMIVITAGFCFASLVLGLFARDIVRIVTASEYFDAYKVVIWLVMGQTVYVMGFVLWSGANIAGRSEFGIPITIAFGIASIGFNLLLIPRWGIVGAVVGSFAGFVLLAVMIYLVAQRLHRIDYPIWQAVLLVAGTLSVYFVMDAWRKQSLDLLMSLVSNGLVLVLVGLVMFFWLTTSEERKRLWCLAIEKARGLKKSKVARIN